MNTEHPAYKKLQQLHHTLDEICNDLSNAEHLMEPAFIPAEITDLYDVLRQAGVPVKQTSTIIHSSDSPPKNTRVWFVEMRNLLQQWITECNKICESPD